MSPSHALQKKNSDSVILDDRFQILRKIDEGTYAKVYYSRDLMDRGREVVIKLIRSRAMTSARDVSMLKSEIQN